MRPGLVTFCDIQPGNGAGLFSKEKTSKRVGREEKRANGEAYDRNKQTIYKAPKSKIESRAHYAPEPTQGNNQRSKTRPKCG